MDWYAGSCSGDKCSQSAANKQQTISLVESLNGSAFKPTGDPSKGVAHDQISPEAKTFNQHWFVDDKQVQLVVGKDSKGESDQNVGGPRSNQQVRRSANILASPLTTAPR
jgi:hypothetical protein